MTISEPVLSFLVYMASGVFCLLVFAFIYVWVTPYAEIRLIRAGNTAASISFGGALIGYALPLSRSIEQSTSAVDLAVWAGLALIVQILIFWLVHLVLPNLSQRIKENSVAESVLLACISVTVGLLNAGSMTI